MYVSSHPRPNDRPIAKHGRHYPGTAFCWAGIDHIEGDSLTIHCPTREYATRLAATLRDAAAAIDRMLADVSNDKPDVQDDIAVALPVEPEEVTHGG